MRKVIFLILFIILLAAVAPPSRTSAHPQGKTVSEIAIEPIRPEWPIVHEASGQWEIVGEVVLSNPGTETVTIEAVHFKAFNSEGEVLSKQRYDEEEFGDMLMVWSKNSDGTYSEKPSGTRELASNDLAFCHVAALAGHSSLPARARVSVHFGNKKSQIVEIPLYVFDPGQQSIWPVPFSGYNWVAMNTAEAYHHWTGINIDPTSGEYNNDQRYAIDILQIDSQYKFSNPPDSLNKEDYYSWNQDILSAWSGTAVYVEKNQTDQPIGSSDENRPRGNFVIIQHGPNLFSLYAHMMNNSATVSIGDAVVAGQVIGKIGNSGSTTAPHLHFEYADAGLQGVPALFWNVKVNRLSNKELKNILGRIPDIRRGKFKRDGETYILNGTTPLEYDIVTAP